MEKITNEGTNTPKDLEIVAKINEIIDSINNYSNQPNCKHNWVQGTSGYWCDKCNKYKV
jgi:hypothetical protein